jgi:hypothetical protein
LTSVSSAISFGENGIYVSETDYLLRAFHPAKIGALESAAAREKSLKIRKIRKITNPKPAAVKTNHTPTRAEAPKATKQTTLNVAQRH